MIKTLTILLMITLSTAAFAQEEKHPLIEYTSSLRYLSVVCGLTTEIKILKGQPVVCDKEHTNSANDSYKKTKKWASGKSELTSQIKDVYASFLTHVDGMTPGSGERKISYKERQESSFSGLIKELNRLNLEVE